MSEPKRPPGRPRKYPQASKHGGAPQINVRLEPDLWEWVQARGGGSWIRSVLHDLREGKLDVLDLAPYDDEETTPEEEDAVRESREQLARGEEGEDLESVAAQFGL